jgi:hypothetical protein
LALISQWPFELAVMRNCDRHQPLSEFQLLPHEWVELLFAVRDITAVKARVIDQKRNCCRRMKLFGHTALPCNGTTDCAYRKLRAI